MKKNDKEKKMLYEWGRTNGVNYHFQEIDQQKNSYYIQREAERDRSSYIREYGFETLPEVMKELDILWENEQVTESIKKAVGVAAIKNKPADIIQEVSRTTNKVELQDKLPAFIYNF